MRRISILLLALFICFVLSAWAQAPKIITFDVPGGHVTGREELVIMRRGAYVFTVLVVGGGSRPTPSDGQALATLQAATIPASLS